MSINAAFVPKPRVQSPDHSTSTSTSANFIFQTLGRIIRLITARFTDVKNSSYTAKKSFFFLKISKEIAQYRSLVVSSIPNHPLRANFPETKITRYNLRNKSPAMPAIHTDRFKNTFFNRIVFKYNVAL